MILCSMMIMVLTIFISLRMFLFGSKVGKEDVGVFSELLHANLDVERFIVA